jgi:hypothetical protein
MVSHDDDWPENWVPFIRPIDGPRGYDNGLHHGPDHQEWENWLQENAREFLALEAASSDGLDSWSMLNAVTENTSIKDVCVKTAGLSAPKMRDSFSSAGTPEPRNMFCSLQHIFLATTPATPACRINGRQITQRSSKELVKFTGNAPLCLRRSH